MREPAGSELPGGDGGGLGRLRRLRPPEDGVNPIAASDACIREGERDLYPPPTHRAFTILGHASNPRHESVPAMSDANGGAPAYLPSG